jgi:asparagine synthase (glutamine-hydrolysing)
MSGGLDSTAVAATALSSCDLRAYTVVYDSLIPDQERHYSGLAANALGIQIRYLAADDYRLFERWDEPQQRQAEPSHNPLRAIQVDQLEQISPYSRVAFYCEGSDNLLRFEWSPYVTDLIRTMHLGRLLGDVALFVASQKRLPFLPGISNRLKRLAGKSADIASYPNWLNPNFASQLDIPGRWEDGQGESVSAHPIRPRACAALQTSNWRYMFEGRDPGNTHFPVEVRYPFLDLRMVRYLLGVPAIPWCSGKYLEREAMRDVLPEAVRRRSKAPLAGDPICELVKRYPEWAQEQPPSTPDLLKYVDEVLHRRVINRPNHEVWMNWINLRPFSLNQWFQGLGRREHGLKKERHNEVGSYQEAI